MFSFTEDVSTNQFTKYFGSAIILDINERENLALLKFEKNEEDFEVWAKSAISYQHKLVYGDSVLAAGENADEIYIIGLLNSLSSNTNRLISSSGSYAVINKNPDEEKILINSKDGEMIFEYDTNSGKSKINIQSGDLEFITNNGNISFTSGGNINFFSKQFIEMESQQGIRLSLKNMIGKLGISSFSINQRNIKLSSPALKILSQQADVQIEDSKYLGNKISATFKEAKFIIGKVENIVNDIISKAKNVYSDVDELVQLKAGRIRTIVKTTLHIKSKNSYLRSEEDFKINAEKIHLG